MLLALWGCSKSHLKPNSPGPLAAAVEPSGAVESPDSDSAGFRPDLPEQDPERLDEVWSQRVELREGAATPVRLYVVDVAIGLPHDDDPSWIAFSWRAGEYPRDRLLLSIGATIVEVPSLPVDGIERVGATVIDMDASDGRKELLVRRSNDSHGGGFHETLDLYLMQGKELEHHRLWVGAVGELSVSPSPRGGLELVDEDCGRIRRMVFQRTRSDVVRTQDEKTRGKNYGDCAE